MIPIRRRASISEEHPLTAIVNAVSYVVKVAEHSYLFPKMDWKWAVGPVQARRYLQRIFFV